MSGPDEPDWGFPEVDPASTDLPPDDDVLEALDALSSRFEEAGPYDTGSDAWWRAQAAAQREAASQEPAVPPAPPVVPPVDTPPPLVQPQVLLPEPPAAPPVTARAAATPQPPSRVGNEGTPAPELPRIPTLGEPERPAVPGPSPLDQQWLPEDLPGIPSGPPLQAAAPPAPPAAAPPSPPAAPPPSRVGNSPEPEPGRIPTPEVVAPPAPPPAVAATTAPPPSRVGNSPEPEPGRIPSPEVVAPPAPPPAVDAPARPPVPPPPPPASVEPAIRPATAARSSVPRVTPPSPASPSAPAGPVTAAVPSYPSPQTDIYEGLRYSEPPPVGRRQAMIGALLAVVGVLVGIVLLYAFRHDRDTLGGPTVSVPTPTTTATNEPTPTTTPSPRPSASATPSARATTPPPAVVAPVRPVLVLNNSKVKGLADRSAARFRAGGWPVSDTGNYRGGVISETTIYYAPGQEGSARRFAKQFAIPRVLPRFSGLPGSGLTVVLTRDYR